MIPVLEVLADVTIPCKKNGGIVILRFLPATVVRRGFWDFPGDANRSSGRCAIEARVSPEFMASGSATTACAGRWTKGAAPGAAPAIRLVDWKFAGGTPIRRLCGDSRRVCRHNQHEVFGKDGVPSSSKA